jgi:hypothetical protein
MRKSLVGVSGLAICLAICLATVTAQAQARGSKPLSKDDQKALDETQEMMRDRSAIDAYAAKNADAKAADAQVKALMGDQTDATYDLASEIFGDLVRQANGDPVKLMKLVEEAKKNPEAFAKKLTPEQKAKINSMATTIDKGSTSSPPH